MSIFDDLKNKVNDAVKKAAKDFGEKRSDVVFDKLPDTYEEFLELPQAALSDPFDTAALTVLAFCYYPKDSALSLKMLDYLRGPRPLSGMDKQFIVDRFRDKDYVPRSYFKGSTYKNDYVPSEPYTVSPFTNPHSDIQENMLRLWLESGGADSPRYVDVRLAKDGKWYLWEQYILAGIRDPESSNPWA